MRNVRLRDWSIHEYITSGTGTSGQCSRTNLIVVASSCRPPHQPLTLQMTLVPIPQSDPPVPHSYILSIAESPSWGAVCKFWSRRRRWNALSSSCQDTILLRGGTSLAVTLKQIMVDPRVQRRESIRFIDSRTGGSISLLHISGTDITI